MVVVVLTLYFGVRRRTGQKRGREGSGIYSELGALGCSKGISPGLVSRVSRLGAMVSFEQASKELGREGVDVAPKQVRRIAERTGAEILTTRRLGLEAWREGRLAAGSELAGKRVGVMTDGGRTRMRENRHRPKRRKKGQKRAKPKYDANWREPKVIVIFELDQKGRMKRGTRAWVDGTFQGPDHAMELIAFHLHRLGAANAEVVSFVSDGAPWIWDRLDWVVQRAGLRPDRVHRTLDFYHAVHHISLALAALGLSEDERARQFKKLRRKLYQGLHLRVMDHLREMGQGRDRNKDAVWNAVDYLERHAMHMGYKQLREAGLPMGSGAIESTIRRVINQRLKGNGIIWLEENAEAMLVLRAALLTERWEETLAHVRATMACHRCLDWQWSSPDILAELKLGPVNPPQLAQVPENQQLPPVAA